jgi:glycosyltransferase involved in cell wall biosynthesis
VTSTLRIGVDARELIGDTTGVGRYLGELIRRWTVRPDAARRRVILYSPAPLELNLPEGAVDVRVAGQGTGTWWEQTTLRKSVASDRPDVFFAPAYTAPLAIRVPLVVTIHDISFVAHPEWFRPRERWRRKMITGRTAKAAAIVLTDSEFSRREIETRLGVAAERIRVIAPGVPQRTALPGLARHDSDRERLVLYVGSIFNRRRLPELIAAFARATPDISDARLVIVGSDRTWPPQDLRAVAAAHGIADRVEVRHYVSDAELSALYARASTFAFLSEYEGFGLTPLEALAAGIPVVVLDTPVAREVYGPAAHYVLAGDLEGTAAALRSFLLSPEQGAAQLAQAPAVLARYSWDRAAADTLEALEAAAR